jgi:hypothetical protein
MKCSYRQHSEASKVNKNVSGLMKALQQSINEAILESNDVAAAMAALKRTGKCPVFSIDVVLEAAPALAVESPGPSSANTEELVLSDDDVAFLDAMGITDPSWCCPSPQSDAA